MTTRVKREQVATFLNVTPATTASYKLLGVGVTSGKISYNPKTTEETYIHESSATITVDSYAPTMSIEQAAISGDDVFDYVDALRIAQAIMSDAESDIVNVWLYKTPTLGEYPAEKRTVAIQIDDFAGDGGATPKINYTINCVGTPVLGTFNPTTKVFTANPNTATLSALTIGGLTLAPLFSGSLIWYVTTTATSPQTVTATSTDALATVTIENGVTLIDTDTGGATGSATLTLGANTITIEVDDGVEIAVYTVVVTKTA